MAELRILNDAGVNEFRSYLVRLKDDGSIAPPLDLLEDVRCSVPAPGEVRVEPRAFASKLDFGRYFYGVAENRIPERELRRSVGLWAWLAFFYIDQTCPVDGHGRRKVLSLEKYIPSAGHVATGLDKHLLFFPWKMVALHRENAAWLLSSPLREDSKVVRELSNSYRRNVSPSFISLARTLYYDDERDRVKRGATTNRPGSLRRLDRVVNQLDLTYDVFGMDATALAGLLPRAEFARWLA